MTSKVPEIDDTTILANHRGGRRKLPATFFDKFVEFLPDWLGDHFRSRQRQLLVLERRLQRKFLNEYRAQVSIITPVLRQRGVILGEVILDAFVHTDHKAKMTYAEALARSVQQSPIEQSEQQQSNFMQKLPLPELVSTLDPLLTPVLSPFVEGLKEPINAKIGDLQRDVGLKVVAACVASAAIGYVAGKTMGGGGRGNR